MELGKLGRKEEGGEPTITPLPPTSRPPLHCHLPDNPSPTPRATTCGSEAASFSLSLRPGPDLVDDQIAASDSPSHPGRLPPSRVSPAATDSSAVLRACHQKTEQKHKNGQCIHFRFVV
ncbi:unnamed protein product [Linum trigynum]|uniref:Uncharacterized protein n=1 Tax=Linum trigynum TaxID=586398 RepID=A0AAV2DYG1_9ROSI